MARNVFGSTMQAATILMDGFSKWLLPRYIVPPKMPEGRRPKIARQAQLKPINDARWLELVIEVNPFELISLCYFMRRCTARRQEGKADRPRLADCIALQSAILGIVQTPIGMVESAAINLCHFGSPLGAPTTSRRISIITAALAPASMTPT